MSDKRPSHDLDHRLADVTGGAKEAHMHTRSTAAGFLVGGTGKKGTSYCCKMKAHRLSKPKRASPNDALSYDGMLFPAPMMPRYGQN